MAECLPILEKLSSVFKVSLKRDSSSLDSAEQVGETEQNLPKRQKCSPIQVDLENNDETLQVPWDSSEVLPEAAGLMVEFEEFSKGIEDEFDEMLLQRITCSCAMECCLKCRLQQEIEDQSSTAESLPEEQRANDEDTPFELQETAELSPSSPFDDSSDSIEDLLQYHESAIEVSETDQSS